MIVLGVGVAAAAPRRKAAAPEEVWVSGNNLEQTVHCHGGALHVLGNGSLLTVEGTCTTVYVEGSRNWIEVQYTELVETRGDFNTVLYLSPRTRVVDPGRANSVAPRWPQ